MVSASLSQEKKVIIFEPIGRRVVVEPDTTLLEAAQQAGIDLIALCGGVGNCGACKVRLQSGDFSPVSLTENELLSAEELASGIRLACQTIPSGNAKIEILPEALSTAQRLQIEGLELAVELDPSVIPVDVVLTPPFLEDLRSDTSRLIMGLDALGYHDTCIGHPVLLDISTRLRKNDWKIRVGLRSKEIVAVLPARSCLLGLAVDIGTTKIAAYLVDIVSGETLAKSGEMNPQIAFGEDIISRIAYTETHEQGKQLLQSRLVESINQMAIRLTQQIGCLPDQIVEAVIVGNTVIHHLFSGLPVHQLGVAPYVPAINHALELRAHDIGLSFNPGAWVYLPPIIAGYVGADHVAMVLASRKYDLKGTALLIDIGTNTEISLIRDGQITSCSCASGPAFEGAHIQNGMRAAPGAIERVKIIDKKIYTRTIGNRPATGICGSGILDVVAELYANGMVNKKGNLNRLNHPVKMDDAGNVILVSSADAGNGQDILVTRKDVHEVQLAKGAIRSGIEILLIEENLSAEDIDEIIIAGAFGAYLDVRNAILIGMLPNLPLNRFKQIGNAAGIGAKEMLVSQNKRAEAEKIASRIRYIELTAYKQFMDIYMKSLLF